MENAAIVEQYGIRTSNEAIKPLGAGLINSTWKIDIEGHGPGYVLQRVNRKVFKSPQDIASNLDLLNNHAGRTEPGYLFIAPLRTKYGETLVEADGEFYRLFPYVPESKTLTVVSSPDLAYEAAKQFGKFSEVFRNFDPAKLKTTIPDFHNLGMRFGQFTAAVNADQARRSASVRKEIEFLLGEQDFVTTYQKIVATPEFQRRVTHHDTKISNVLFSNSNLGICVIDLDTTMAGLYISDVGDMMRTYLPEAGEEEKDVARVEVRPMYFEAIAEGYLSQMSSHLTREELSQFLYSGYFLIYMQALRFLADYLNGDQYYSTTYEGQNLVRASNQIALLRSYRQQEAGFKRLLTGRKFY